MPALSSFYTFLSGGTECTQNFVENSDYILSGSSLFINLSSNKWSNVDTVVTTVCALDLLDVRPFSNIVLKVSGSYQPYLSTGAFFYNVGTGTGFVSCREWATRTFPVYDLTFLYFGYSSICDTIDIFGKYLENFVISNNSNLTGINLDPSCSLSAVNYFALVDCNNIDLTSLESFISTLANDTLETGGTLCLGISANASENLATSIEILTGTKSWIYSC